jgi:hypothetical protein
LFTPSNFTSAACLFATSEGRLYRSYIDFFRTDIPSSQYRGLCTKCYFVNDAKSVSPAELNEEKKPIHIKSEFMKKVEANRQAEDKNLLDNIGVCANVTCLKMGGKFVKGLGENYVDSSGVKYEFCSEVCKQVYLKAHGIQKTDGKLEHFNGIGHSALLGTTKIGESKKML